MLKDLTDAEVMEDAAAFLDDPSGLDGVFLGRLVEVALLIVPLGDTAPRVLGAHLQIERNGDERLLAGRFFLRATRHGSAEQGCGRGDKRSPSYPRGLVHAHLPSAVWFGGRRSPPLWLGFFLL